MQSVIFYVAATFIVTVSTAGGLYYVQQNFSKQNQYNTDRIVRGKADQNQYTLFSLPNQLKVMIITSNSTEVSSIGMSVQTGYFEDPEDFQGLSNLLQRLLIANIEKSKQTITDYLQFSSSISEISTNYYIQVNNMGFFRALESFAKIFTEIQLDETILDRTIESIHSDWKNALINDVRDNKIHNVQKILSRPKHPYGKFAFGNLQTLRENPEKRKTNTFLDLRKHYRNNYSANRMTLFYLQKKKKKSQGQRATELVFQYFQQLIDKQLRDLNFNNFGIPITEQQIVYLNSDSMEKELIIFFNLHCDEISLFYTVEVLMKYFDKNFCFEQLKKKNSILCNYKVYDVYKHFSIFEIQLTLTPKGADQVDEIIKSLFRRIHKLQTSSEITLSQYFEKIKNLQQIRFDYYERDSQPMIYAKNQASIIKRYFGYYVLLNQTVPSYNIKKIQEVIHLNLTAKNLNIILRTNFTQKIQDYKLIDQNLHDLSLIEQAENTSSQIDHKQKIYKYRKIKKFKHFDDQNDQYYEEGEEEQYEEYEETQRDELDQPGPYDLANINLQNLWNIPQSEFKTHPFYAITMATGNISTKYINSIQKIEDYDELMNIENITKYLPQQYNLVNQTEAEEKERKDKKKRKGDIRTPQSHDYKYPELLESTTNVNLWILNDTSTNIPKVVVRYLVRYLDADQAHYENFQLINLIISKIQLQFQLELKDYLHFSMDRINITSMESQCAIEISFVCYSSTINQIIPETLRIIKESHKIINQEDLDIILQYANVANQKRKNRPLNEQALIYLRQLLTNSQGYKKFNFQNISDISIVQPLLKIFQNQRWEILFYGNIDSSLSRNIWNNTIKPQLVETKTNNHQIPPLQTFILRKHPITYRVKFQSNDPYNIITLNYYQWGERNITHYTQLKMLESLLQQFKNEQLRLKMEVASYVNVEVTTIGNMDGISIVVMSSNYDPEELDFYIEESLGYFENWFNKITEYQFEFFKYSLLGEILLNPEEINLRSNFIWSKIRNGDFYFPLRECITQVSYKITRKDIRNIFEQLFKKKNSKLSVQLYNPQYSSNIPTQVLGEEDTYSRTVSKFISNEEDLRKEGFEISKFTPKIISETPRHQC